MVRQALPWMVALICWLFGLAAKSPAASMTMIASGFFLAWLTETITDLFSSPRS